VFRTAQAASASWFCLKIFFWTWFSRSLLPKYWLSLSL
jgi:hypothetical protein